MALIKTTDTALDIALWDLKARRANVPLFRLLGGSPEAAVYPGPLFLRSDNK